MANNQIGVTEGSGKDVATETIAAKDYGIVKIADGTVGSTTPLIVNADGSINTNFGAASVLAITIGSVITVNQGSSIIAIAAGSVVTLSQGSVINVWQNPSIAGTYAEDAAHTVGDRGLFNLAVRNDTMASVTSATGDYSQYAVGPSGETITANAPLTQWVRGTADLRGPVTVHSVTVIAAQGASVFTYVTGVQVLNFGPSSVIVTFSGATSSIVGYTIAPAGGGSNIYYPNALKTNANAAFAASVSGLSSVIVSAQGFTARI